MMRIPAGTRLGPYQVVSPVGTGGMGDVYRARDPRLGRDVAVKFLSASLAGDADMLRRFETEARAAGALNHPNILAVYDTGSHEGVPYIVSELLEGATLREKLAGDKVPVRKAVEWARQIAHGLAIAHDTGIIHRDLKPENLFVTKDGRAKILDFGLAKLTERGATPAERSTEPSGTEPGTVLGTVGYMSPEQVRGKAADHRSDIFSFGAVLYEMLSGRRAFRGDSAVETMNAILKEEPPEISMTSETLPPALERITRRCLEKQPVARFRSAHDLAFALDTLTELSGTGPRPAGISSPPIRRRVGAALTLLTLLVAASFSVGRLTSPSPERPTYRRLTFRRGRVDSARFGPDGKTILYSALWDGKPVEVFSGHIQRPEWRPLGLPNTTLLSVSSSGDMALFDESTENVLRMAVAGGAPRAVVEAGGPVSADWSPDGTQLAVSRWVGERDRLEFPIGKVLREGEGHFLSPRVSPKGGLLACIERPRLGDTAGSVVLLEPGGGKRILSAGWDDAAGLAWSPEGNEVWFTAARGRDPRALHAVSLWGRERVVERGAGWLTLQDISREGRILVTRDDNRRTIMALPPGATTERDLSWLGYSGLKDLSADGETILFDETAEGGGLGYSVYLRRTDGSPAVRLGEGAALALSPDGKWALSLRTSPEQLVVLPVGAGEPRPLARERISYQERCGAWLPDGKRVIFGGEEPGHGTRFYVQEIDGGKPRPVTPEDVFLVAISPDGRFLAGIGQKGGLYPLDGGEPREIPGFDPGDIPIRWSGDGRFLFVYKNELPAKVYRLDLSTGRKELWKELMPSDPAGVLAVFPVRLSSDGISYAYTYRRMMSDLYLVEGLR